MRLTLVFLLPKGKSSSLLSPPSLHLSLSLSSMSLILVFLQKGKKRDKTEGKENASDPVYGQESNRKFDLTCSYSTYIISSFVAS